MVKVSQLAIVLFIPLAVWSQQPTQTVRLRNGSEVTGAIVGADGRDLTIRDRGDNTRRFRFDEIDSIVFNSPPPRQESYRDDRRDYRDNDRARMVVPAGSEISVRSDGRIEATGPDNRTWPAQVERDVIGENGEVVIPRGSDAQLVVRNLDRNALTLDLESVTVNGRQYMVDTQDVDVNDGRQGVGANRRTGEFVGGGAVLGTLLGAIAGGGKGAAIGALAGGAAGAGAQVLTRGDRVSVPPETVLNFRLDRPLALRMR